MMSLSICVDLFTILLIFNEIIAEKNLSSERDSNELYIKSIYIDGMDEIRKECSEA